MDELIDLAGEDADIVANTLYVLSERLGALSPDTQTHGLLGGQWCYGQEFENTIFEMHPYYWGECTCGYEEHDGEWWNAHPHADDCYQSELDRRIEASGGNTQSLENRFATYNRMASEYGLPEAGSAVHCTCGVDSAWEVWHIDNDHDSRCPIVLPNFIHKSSDIAVSWYKYIGRSMKITPDVDAKHFADLVDECLASLPSLAAADIQGYCTFS